MKKSDKNTKVQNREYYLNLEEQDKVYRYIYGIGDQYLKLLKEKNKYRLKKIFKYDIDLDINFEINRVKLEDQIEEKRIELKEYLKELNYKESMMLIKELIDPLYRSEYNELTYFTIESIVDIFLEREIKISREEIEKIVDIDESKTEKQKINLAEGLLKLLYIVEDEDEEETKKLGFKYIKDTWFNRYIEYLAIKELKKIRRNIDVQYRKKAIEDLIKTQSEYSNIYEKDGEKIIIRICRI